MRLTIPWTDERELEEIAAVLKTGFFTQGPVVKRFEDRIASIVGAKYAFATSSCTTALHLALSSLGIQSGDEVLVADFTFPATANVVVQQGATPILVDIDLDTFTINMDDVKRKMNARTKAIMPVDAFGVAANLDPLLEIGEEWGVPILEDAACALGATYKDRYVGNISELTCFSFHPRKSITTGEGGMVTTNNDELAERIEILRNHGGVHTGYWYEYVEAGYNYRLSDILGALGLAQLEKFESALAKKQTLAGKLTELIRDIPGIQTPQVPPWGNHTYQSFVILVEEGINRDQVINDLREMKIESTIGTYAVHDQPFYQKNYGYQPGEIANSHYAFTHTISLPFYPQMTEAELKFLAESLRQVILASK